MISQPLIQVSLSQIPAAYQRRLGRFPFFLERAIQLKFYGILLILFSLPVLIFMIHVIVSLFNQKRIMPADVLAFVIPVGPFLLWAVGRFFSEYQKTLQKRTGTYFQGLHLDENMLLWCVSPRQCTLISKNDFEGLFITSKPVHRYGFQPDQFLVTVAGKGSYQIDSASYYDVRLLWRVLQQWCPSARFEHQSNLDGYFSRRDDSAHEDHVPQKEQDSPFKYVYEKPTAVVLDHAPETAHNLEPFLYFRALLDAAGINYKFLHGKVTGMIDAPASWVFERPLKIRKRDLGPMSKAYGGGPDDFVEITEYPYNDEWNLNCECRPEFFCGEWLFKEGLKKP